MAFLGHTKCWQTFPWKLQTAFSKFITKLFYWKFFCKYFSTYEMRFSRCIIIQLVKPLCFPGLLIYIFRNERNAADLALLVSLSPLGINQGRLICCWPTKSPTGEKSGELFWSTIIWSPGFWKQIICFFRVRLAAFCMEQSPLLPRG